MKAKLVTVLIFNMLQGAISLSGQSFSFAGQVSAMHVSKFSKPWQSLTGLRYLPEIKWNTPVGKTLKFDVEASANAFGQVGILTPDSLSADINLKPYRVWGRMATERFELRLGLQKISFGSASMLRPLMWFDHLDPRDPLQLTDGVCAILGRYFFQNNSNIWLWGILPGKTVKGWEFLAGDCRRPEFGGRLQVPAGKGELAVSVHFRYLGTDQSRASMPMTIERPLPEYRAGLDGKWDIGPGIWFEGSYAYANLPKPETRHLRMLTIGADYTFGLGNGLTFTTEQFFYQTGPSVGKSASEIAFTAGALTYPINLTHSLSAMLFYNWTDNSWYRFVNWRISLKKVSFYLMAFWNPESFDIYQNTGNTSLMGGKGLQLLFVWNH